MNTKFNRNIGKLQFDKDIQTPKKDFKLFDEGDIVRRTVFHEKLKKCRNS